MQFQEYNNELARAIGILHEAERDELWSRSEPPDGFWEQVEAHRETIASKMSQSKTLGLTEEIGRFMHALGEAKTAEEEYLKNRLRPDDDGLLPFKTRLEQASWNLRERMRELVARMGIELGRSSPRNWSRGR